MWQPEQCVGEEHRAVVLGVVLGDGDPLLAEAAGGEGEAAGDDREDRVKQGAHAAGIILSGEAPCTSRSLAPHDARVDPADFRAAMALLPTGVTVVTAPGPEGPAGATANAVRRFRSTRC